jgi:hypothetical protein
VVEESAYRKNGQEPGRPITAKHPSLRFLRETITAEIADMGVGKAHSSEEVRET